MHVLHLAATGSRGGAERSLLDILASARDADPDLKSSIVAGSDGGLLSAAAALGATARSLPFGPALATLGEAGRDGPLGAAALAGRLAWSAAPAMRYASALRQVFDELRPSVVHSHGLKMHILAARALSGRTAGPRPRLVWHFHDYVGGRPATARLLRWNVRSCDALVANSSSVGRDVRRALQPTAPVVVVLNAVDLERFNPDGPRADLDRLAGFAPPAADVVRVGLIASFARWKGHQTFFDAIARLGSGAAVRGYVIGGPLYQTAGSQYTVEELRAAVAARGISDRVGFTGFIDAADEAIRALDVVVHASTSPEPFGLVIAEGLACGRAVIASDAGGAREIFTAGVDALAHPPGDAGALAAAIRELARNAGLRERLGQAGRQAAERRFNRRRLAPELRAVYETPLRAAS